MKDPGEGIRTGRDTDLERTVRQFAAKLRSTHAEEIGQDPRKFKKRVVTLLRRNLPPFAGRPSEASITAAIQLQKEGRTWKEIYPQVIEGHSTMDLVTRRQAESNIRSGVRSRRNAARRRKRLRSLTAETKPPVNVPSFQEPTTRFTLGVQ